LAKKHSHHYPDLLKRFWCRSSFTTNQQSFSNLSDLRKV